MPYYSNFPDNYVVNTWKLTPVLLVIASLSENSLERIT